MWGTVDRRPRALVLMAVVPALAALYVRSDYH